MFMGVAFDDYSVVNAIVLWMKYGRLKINMGLYYLSRC